MNRSVFSNIDFKISVLCDLKTKMLTLNSPKSTLKYGQSIHKLQMSDFKNMNKKKLLTEITERMYN